MIVVHDPVKMQKLVRRIRQNGKTIGFVPTMGALHDGHTSLVRASVSQCDVTIVSIFLNPTQFAPNEDLDKYPKSFDQDCFKVSNLGTDIIFAPSPSEMYSDDFETFVSVTTLSKKLEGKLRPTHFRGVTTVVLKLFNIVMPDKAFFGQKDAQQAIIIKKMVRDLNVPVEIFVMPIIRGNDGFALSSRNVYLTYAERRDAPYIFKGLLTALKLRDRGELNSDKLKEAVKKVLEPHKTLYLEYIEIVDANTLETINIIRDRALILIACKTTESQTRLIDNVTIGNVF